MEKQGIFLKRGGLARSSLKIIAGSFFILIIFILSWLIVWQAVYFLLFLGSICFLAIFFWKTEESLIFLIFYLPFQLALNVSSSIDLASGRLLIVVLFLIWIIKSIAKKRLFIPYSSLTGFIIFFLGLAALSAYFSIDQGRSAVRLLFFMSIFPLYFISAAYSTSVLKIAKIVYILLFSAATAGIIGVIQFLGQFIFGIDAIIDFWSKNVAYLFYGQSFGKIVIANPSWLVNIGGETIFRAISFFPDPHMFAFFLGLVIPIVLCLAFFSNIFNFSRWQKFLLYAGNAILVLALCLTFSRAGYVGAFFGILAVVLLGWKFFNKKVKFAVWMIVFFSSITLFNSSNLVVSRFISSFNLSEGSNSERMLNWRQAVNIIKDHPVAGVGVGAYAQALNARSPERSSVTAHNTYLDIAAEMGIPALIVWIIIIILAIKNLLNVYKTKGDGLSKEKVIAIGLIGAFVWFSVQMIFDTAIYSPTLLAVLMLYLALSVNLTKSEIILK